MNGDAPVLQRLQALLERLAYQIRPCKKCGRKIYLLRLPDGKTLAYSESGVDHRIDCAGGKPRMERYRAFDSLREGEEWKTS